MSKSRNYLSSKKDESGDRWERIRISEQMRSAATAVRDLIDERGWPLGRAKHELGGRVAGSLHFKDHIPA